MFTGISDTRKLHIIEAILKTNDEGVLQKIEAIVDDSDANGNRPRGKFSELLGLLTIEDANTMKKAIDDNFEKVDPDDWK